MQTRDDRLSRIKTCWQQVREAHEVRTPDQLSDPAALWGLLDRYAGAVERYLLGALRDPDQAQELAQEFAVEFLRGATRGANPDRGRFRDYVKGILQHLIAQHYRKENRRPISMPTDFPEKADSSLSDVATDAEFLTCWRDELLARAWQSLADLEATSQQPYHLILKHKSDHPEQSSEEMASALSERLGKPINPPAARKALQRAREKFADCLLDDLRLSLQQSSPESLESELIDLRLYEYCRPALDRLQSKE
jgi:DNA-directed RNA polymerase specialized sigma24 family protein